MADNKELLLASRLVSLVQNGQYSELDIHSLLVLLREHSRRDTALHEFANFVAHRQKDRGKIHQYLVSTKDMLDNLGKKPGVIEIAPVYTAQELLESINEVLTSLNLQTLPPSCSDELLTCVMCLLQSIRLVHHGAEVGKLLLGATQSELQLLCLTNVQNKADVVFPALIVPNRYVNGAPVGDTPAFLNPMRAVAIMGSLRLEPDATT